MFSRLYAYVTLVLAVLLAKLLRSNKPEVKPTKPTDVYQNPDDFLGPQLKAVKPCPACGGEPHVISCLGRVSIACGKCGLMTPLVEQEHWGHILSRWQSRV